MTTPSPAAPAARSTVPASPSSTATASGNIGATGDRFPWLPILALGAAGFLGLTVELSPAGLLGEIARDLDVSLAAVGTLTTFFALGNALLILPLTALALRFVRRTALVSVMAAFVISNIVVAATPTIAVADIGRFIGGGSYAVLCALVPAVAVRMAGPRYTGRALTITIGANTLGMALGAPLASLTGDAFGWRMVFLAAAGIAVLLAVLLSLTVPHLRSAPEHRVPLLEAMRLPGLLRVAGGWSLLMLGHFVVLTYIDAYLHDLGVAAFVTSIALFVLGAGGVLGVVLIGRLAQRSLFAALIAAPAVVAVAFAVLALHSPALPVVLGAITLWGIGFSATVMVYQQALLQVGQKAPETATSIGVLLSQIGFAIGATLGGVVVETLGVTALPIVAATVALATIALATTLRPTIEKARAKAQADAAARTATPIPAGR
ncbi:MAG: MFS transporter [Actinomycetota bacterium]